MVLAKRGWLCWLEVAFLATITVACAGSIAMLALDPEAPIASGYRIVALITGPFAALHFGIVLMLWPNRTLEADEKGIRLYRGTNLRTNLAWPDVREVRLGYLPKGSRYHGKVQQGYRIQVLGKHSRRPISLDSVRYDIPTAELLRFALGVSVVAQSYAVRVVKGPDSSRTSGAT